MNKTIIDYVSFSGSPLLLERCKEMAKQRFALQQINEFESHNVVAISQREKTKISHFAENLAQLLGCVEPQDFVNKDLYFAALNKELVDVTFSCDIDSSGGDNGGSGNGDGSGSGDGSGGGTTTPETPDTDNNDVVAAIDNLKLDTNTRLDKLMEQAEAQQTAQSGKLDEVKNAIDTASDKNQQALVGVNESLDGLTDSVSNLNASNSANSSAQLAALGKLNQSVQGVDDKLNQINTTLKNTNASGVGINVCQIGECKSFYDPKFSDGLTGVLSSRFDSMKTVVTSGIADTFNAIDLGNSSRPSYTVSFDFGFANYGSFDVFAVAHLNTVFTFLRAFFMACCLFYARSLVFGG